MGNIIMNKLLKNSLIATILLFIGSLSLAASDLGSFAIPETDEGLPGEGPIRRYEWFQNLWKERRAGFAITAYRDQGAVVFLGDSITQGWGNSLAAVFPGMHVANRGISGDTTRGVLIRLQEDVLSLNPRAVVLLIGTNDIEEKASPEMIVSNIRLILEELRKLNPKMPVIFCDVFPSTAEWQRPKEKIREINRLMRKTEAGNPQIIWLDTYDLFADESGDAIPSEFPDMLHPNDIGNAKWAAALRPIFATLGLIETEKDFVLEDGFELLFDGNDLDGWGYRPTTNEDKQDAINWQKGDPEGAAVWPFVDEAQNFDGLTSSPDGRFVAINGKLAVTTPCEYRKIQQIWTQREFDKDFTLKLEFRATPNADSGIYIRGPQLQCRDYVLAGPWKDLKNYMPQGWNEMVVTVKGTVAHCVCNGEVLIDAMEIPAKGPIGLEGDRGQMEYRRIRIKIEE
jgi:lysophospholipase L1-like esterase